jgi:hypothetical protein
MDAMVPTTMSTLYDHGHGHTGIVRVNPLREDSDEHPRRIR